MLIEDQIKCVGWIDAVIEYKDGRKEELHFKNTVLRIGRNVLATCLTNTFVDGFNSYIAQMIFGDGGTSAGSLLSVDTNRNGLYGITRASKPVIASIDPTCPTKAIFTSVLTFNDANGFSLSEMALVMNSGNLFSLSTFPNLSKTNQMQITWSWSCNFV